MKISNILLQFRLTVGAEDMLTLWQEMFWFGSGCIQWTIVRFYWSLWGSDRQMCWFLHPVPPSHMTKQGCVFALEGLTWTNAYSKHCKFGSILCWCSSSQLLQSIPSPFPSLLSHTVTVKQFWMSKLWIAQQTRASIQVLTEETQRMQEGRKEFVRRSRMRVGNKGEREDVFKIRSAQRSKE